MHKFNNNLSVNCLSQLYERTDSVHDHNTRDCQLLRVQTSTKTFSNMSVRVWNVCRAISFKRSISHVEFNKSHVILRNDVQFSKSTSDLLKTTGTF